MDALEYLDTEDQFDAIHASPPCQRYSMMSKCRPGLADKYPDLVGPVRERLRETSLPHVIENVPGAPLIAPLELCGCDFGLTAEFNGRKYGLQRRRLFESDALRMNGFFRNTVLSGRPHCHPHPSFPVFGNGAPGNRPDLRGRGFTAAAREAMGIDWMTREELAEAIPPAFTEYVGSHLLAAVGQRAAA